jgi:hypothetical protein
LNRLARAYRAARLLSEMLERYWREECTGPKLDLEEMLGYVRFAVDAVRKAQKDPRQQSQTLRKAHAGTSHAAPIASEAGHPSSASTTQKLDTRYTFSQGTIDRQLCYIPPLRSQCSRPSRPSLDRTYAPLGWISYSNSQLQRTYAPPASRSSSLPRSHLPNTFPNPASNPNPATDPMRAILDHCSSTRISRGRGTNSESESDSSEDHQSVTTNPFEAYSSSTPVHTPAKLQPTRDQHSSKVSVAKTYLDGRDNWECDFCGPECFCWGFDD